MQSKKSIWSSITGGFTSAAPVLLSCCKSGACVGVCTSPVASLFGISSASIAGSPVISVLEPLLIAISAVSFTVSYYSIYVLPKQNCNTEASCACASDEKEKRKTKINKFVFWFGLILSIGFLSYFEVTKYQAVTNIETSCTQSAMQNEDCCKNGETNSCNEE
jgi:hypothetical protein